MLPSFNFISLGDLEDEFDMVNPAVAEKVVMIGKIRGVEYMSSVPKLDTVISLLKYKFENR
ncbi:hypothetical protein D3C72_2019490 [compost metagenome]